MPVGDGSRHVRERRLEGRDLQIVRLVSHFGQVASRHVHEIVFPENASYTPSNRALRRLTEQGWLARIDIRLVGGRQGGSGQYVYQLGRRGYYLNNTGRYVPAKAVRLHTIAIVDTFVELLRLHRAGRIVIEGFSTEPDCHVVVGGVQLKPDMFVELQRPDDRLKLWFEVDLGTEAQRQLKGKLEAYYRAWCEADDSEWPVFPRVLWVTLDEERARELAWLIKQEPAEAQRERLFEVTTISNLSRLF